MQLAIRYINDDHMMVEPVALRLGYGSSAAFTRAYKRIVGSSPKAGTVQSI
ncbi:TPA: helix-turn-helix transcriptional regulator [Escherichia coli]|nr:AraC family transcriptional regulator [Escherichia coli]MED0155226.1 AraC family transcriptional regulator [Escherichia coli]MED0287481.1 AraC family transcriptional regulator [Escherichia coli]MED9056412.1 AraC family transcriptional regulator [Escherichia coli]MED9072608.1 AraC family transcriptional regulator [Escherichia coli]